MHSIPGWAEDLLCCPLCKSAVSISSVSIDCATCGEVGHVDEGVVRFSGIVDDSGVEYYRVVEGPKLYDRMQIPFTTSALDSQVYRTYLEEIRPADRDAVIVDAGAGDGRNLECWLDWKYERLVATDAILPALKRLRSRIASERPDALQNVLLIESDIRSLPLRSGSCDIVTAIEVLCLLNREYEVGLQECIRILKGSGTLMVSDYSAEGAYLSRLIYGGIPGMIEIREQGTLTHTFGSVTAPGRLLTEEELARLIDEAGVSVEHRYGLSVLSPVIGFLRGLDKLGDASEVHASAVASLLTELGRTGKMKRTEVMIGRKRAA